MTQENKWEDYDWDNFGDQVHHFTIQDLRRYLFLATEGHTAIADKTKFQAPPTEDDVRFASAWKDIFYGDYPTADVVYDNTGNSPTEYEGAVQYPQIRPGSVTCYFDRSFTHDCLGVVKTGDDYEFKFAATQLQKYGIYNENESIIDVNGTLETWYEEEDDFRPGTPFIIEAAGADDATNNGFYRVRSVRNDGSYVYVIADNNNYEQQELKEVTYSNTAAVCDFGGDWYMLIGQNGNSMDEHMKAGGRMKAYLAGDGDYAYIGDVRERWWSTKDIAYHRYEKTAGEVTYGPNDGRPPTGGQFSKDFNADWVRCVNSNLYHTYDRNAHRCHVECETDGSISSGTYQQYTALIPSWKFLCFQADPKEGTESPFFFKDTNRLHWKYSSKIGLSAAQITNTACLGPVQAVRKLGYKLTGQSSVGTSTDHQYNSTYTYEGALGQQYAADGYLPFISGQAYETKWKDDKYDNALQVMVELACAKHNWLLEIDDDYKYNWLWVHKYSTINAAFQEWLEYSHGLADGALDGATYWDIYQTYGLSEAYNPNYNPDQPKFAYLTDEYWGENGSAFELILKILGSDYYDWYLDEAYPYQSKRLLDQNIKNKLGESTIWWNETYTTRYMNGVQVKSVADGGTDPLGKAYEACYPTPVGVWRRTWKYGFGRIKPCKMRDGSRGTPEGFPSAAEPGDWPYEFYGVLANEGSDPKTVRMVGRVVMDTPTVDNVPEDDAFYTWQESTLTVPDPENPNTILFIEDKTDQFKTGNIVWTKKEDEYLWYYVLKVSAVSIVPEGEEYPVTCTYVTLSDDFATDGPSHLRGDENLSLHHDPSFVVNDMPQYGTSRLPTILKHARAVLKKLEYKGIDVSIAYVGEGHESYPEDGPWPTRAALLERYKSDIASVWDDDMANWPPFNISTGWFGVRAGYMYSLSSQTWNVIDRCNVVQIAVKITTPVYYDKDAVTFVHALKFRGAAIYEQPRDIYVGIEGYGTYLIPNWDVANNEYPPFKIIYLPIVAESDTVKYIRIKILGDLDDWVLVDDGMSQYRENWSTYLIAYVKTAGLTAGSEFTVRFDWDKYSDDIFKRTKERPDYRLIDQFGPDTNPPVIKNEWVIEPTLYDANFPEFTYDDSYQYDKETHTPEYKIKAESVLMEDLEGNGVLYLFEFAHGVYETEAEYMNSEQESREYNKALSDYSSGWSSYDALIEEWGVTLNSRDNYSGSVPGESDNVGTPTSIESISLDDNLPMFPVKPRVEYEKIEVDSVWYDHIWTDVPICNNSLEYLLEQNSTVLYDFGVTNPAPPTGGDAGDNHFYISGAGITEVSTDKYVMRYKNATTLKPGLYSDECGL